MSNYALNNEVVTLKDVESFDTVTHKDFNTQYCYKKVFDPSNQFTKFYSLHFKDEGNEKWKIKSGLLSNKYSIVPTQYILDNIKRSVDKNLNIDSTYNWDTFTSIFFTIDDISLLNVNRDKEELIQIIKFKLLTNINIQEYAVSDTLNFILTNSFGGEKNVNVSFGLNTIFKSSDKTHQINNIFILDKFKIVFKHLNLTDMSVSKLTDIKNNIDSRIQKFKDKQLDNTIIEEISKYLGKKENKKFIPMINSLSDQFKNLYYLTYILSSIFTDKQILRMRAASIKNLINALID